MSDRQPRKKKLQFLLAGGVSAALLTPLVAFGGIGFAGTSPSAAQYEYGGGKTTLCHRTHSKKHPGVTITVGNAAVPAHMRHGDKPGPCPTTAATTTTSTSEPAEGKGDDHGQGQGQGQGNDQGKGNDHGQGQGQGHGNGHGKP